MTPSYRSIIKGVGLFGAARAVHILTALVRTKCAARMLGTLGVGMNAIFYTVQMFTNLLLGLGLSAGSVKALSQAYASGDSSYIDTYVTQVRHLGMLCGGAAILLLALLSPWLSQFYFHTWQYVPHFLLLGVGTAALIVCDIEQSVMRSLQCTRRLALSMVFIALAALVCTVPFYVLLGVQGVIYAIVSCSVASAIICIVLGHQCHPFRLQPSRLRQWRSFWQASQSMVRSGLAFLVTGLLLQGSELVLQSVLATVASVSMVGLFKVGYQCSVTYPGMIFTGIANDYFPRLAALPEDDIAGRRVVIMRQIRVMFLLSLPVALALCLLAPYVISLLLSPEFMVLVPMFRWAIFSILIRAVYLPLCYIPLALDRRLHYLLIDGLSSVGYVIVVLTGYWLNGLVGIGQGILVGSVFDLLFCLWFCRRQYPELMTRKL